MKLLLGVLDVAYGQRGKSTATPSTGDVAEILESRYHVMEHFWEAHGQEAADALTQAMADFFADRMAGSGANAPSFLAAEADIQTAFVKFIDSKEMDGLGYPGIPTKASLRGVNHRMKHPYAKRPPRPSFRDTGLYEASFRAQVEE